MLIYLQMIESEEDRSKFEIIYKECESYMYNVAYDILHNIQDAEDAVHHAFVRIAENMNKVGDPHDPQTFWYAVTIAENRAIDMYRRNKAHPIVPYNDEVRGIQVEYDNPNELANCILKLPERERTVLILKYWHGYPYKEIADMLGISYANALKIGQRAKAHLKTICEEAEVEC